MSIRGLFKSKKWIVFALFGIFFITELILFNPQDQRLIETLNFENTSLNNKNIKIDLPKRFLENDSYPLIILVTGDSVKPAILNYLRRELILNNIGVVTFTSDMSWRIIPEIFKIVSFLRTSIEFKDHPRGIYGHSHGAHYALLTSLMIPYEFEFTICTNFGTYHKIRYDLLMFNENFDFTNWGEYYNGIIKPQFSKVNQYILNNKSIPIDAISNLLIMANENDRFFQDHKESLGTNYTEFWNIETLNELQGNYLNGSARYFYVGKTIFPHTSGIFHPNFIYFQLSWITESLNLPLKKSKNFILTDLLINYIVSIGYLILACINFYFILIFIFEHKFVKKEFKKDLSAINILRISVSENSFDRSFGMGIYFKDDETIDIDKITDTSLLINLRAVWLKEQIKQIIVLIMIGLIVFAISNILLFRWVIDVLVPQYIEDIFFVRSIPFDFGFYFLVMGFYIHDNYKIESVFETQFKKRQKSKRVLKIVGILVNILICGFYMYITIYQIINISFIILIIMVLLNIFLFYLIIIKISEIYRIILYKSKNKSKITKNLWLIGLFLVTILIFYTLFFSIPNFRFSIMDMLLLNHIPIIIMIISSFFGVVYQQNLMKVTLFIVGINLIRRISLIMMFLL